MGTNTAIKTAVVAITANSTLRVPTTAAALGPQLAAGCDALAETTDWLLAEGKADMARVLAGATPYLRLFATVAGGAMMARATLAAQAALDAGTGDPALGLLREIGRLVTSG